jgi:hypothetical protein
MTEVKSYLLEDYLFFRIILDNENILTLLEATKTSRSGVLLNNEPSLLTRKI